MEPNEEKPPVVIEDMAVGVEAPVEPVQPEMAQPAPVEAQMAEIAPETPVEQAPVEQPTTPEVSLVGVMDPTAPAKTAGISLEDAVFGRDVPLEGGLPETLLEEGQPTRQFDPLLTQFRTLPEELTDAELYEAKEQIGFNYVEGILKKGEPERDKQLIDFLNGSVSWGVGSVDRENKLVTDGDGNAVVNKVYPFSMATTGDRAIELFEAIDNPSGVYVLYDADGNRAEINLTEQIQQLRKPIQEYGQGVFRLEEQGGGMAFYDDVLKNKNVKDPYKRLYYIRQQAQAGPFSGIEGTRVGVALKDLLPGLYNFGVMGVDYGIDITLGAAAYTAETIQTFLSAGRMDDLPYGYKADKAVDLVRDTLSFGMTMPYVDMAADRYARSFGVPVEEAEAVLGYTPDIASTFKRFALESIIPGVTILGGSRVLAGRIAGDYAQFAVQKHKNLFDPKERLSIEEIAVRLEENGHSFKSIFDDYVRTRGGGEKFRKKAERALDLDMQYRSFSPTSKGRESYNSRVKPMQDEYDALGAQIDEAYEKSMPSEYIRRLQDRRAYLARDIKTLQNDYILPKEVKDFLVDEGIALTAASLGYSTVYQLTEGNEGASGIASFVSVLASVMPSVRHTISAKFEDVQYAYQRGKYAVTGKEGLPPPSKEAVMMRRRVQNMDPSLRDKAFAHFQEREAAKTELSKFKYPDDHPNPELRGKPIISDDALDVGFYRMSGLLSLKALRTQEMGDNVNFVSDAGEFSEKLARLEAQLEQEQQLVEQMSDVVQNLKYYTFTEAYDPNSPAGMMTDTLIKFYDAKVKEIEQDQIDLQEILLQRDNTLDGIWSGQITNETVEDFITGRRSLRKAIAVDLERFKKYELKKDATLEEQAEQINEYLLGVNNKLADAMANYDRINQSDHYKTGNVSFINYVERSEVSAYEKASHEFDKLRAAHPNARIDVTEIFEEMVTGTISADNTSVEALAMSISAEGSKESRRLAKLDLPASMRNGISSLFQRSATEAVDSLRGQSDEATELVDRILEAEEATDAHAVDQFLILKEFFEAEGLTDQYKLQLGIDATEFMHVTSALGSYAKVKEGQTAAIAAAQLRETLLTRAETEFYEGFYGPLAQRTQVTGWKTKYDAARAFYKSSYIDIFRNTDSVIAQITRNPESKNDVDIDALQKFLKNNGAGRPLVQADVNRGITAILRQINGGKLNVSTGRGRMLRTALTNMAIEQVFMTTLGGKEMQKFLIEEADSIGRSAQILTPKGAKELQSYLTKLKQGKIRTEAGLNLATLLKIKDDNGVPIVDMEKLDYAISVDHLAEFDPRARRAINDYDKKVKKETQSLLKQMEDFRSVEANKMEARKAIVRRLDVQDGGLGQGFINLVNQNNGVAKVNQIKDEFVESQVKAGVDREVAETAFEQVVRQTVIDSVFDDISEAGGNRMSVDVDAEGSPKSKVSRKTIINPEKLAKLIGYRGESGEVSRKEEAMLRLLGKETMDHLKLVFNTLYEFDEGKRPFRVTGISMPMSAESALSRVTSYFRGVISMRWLISEAAIRKSRESNYELTKIMLFDPKIGREVLDMISREDFTPERFIQVEKVLLQEIARNDAIQKFALQQATKEEEDSTVDVQVQQLLDSSTITPPQAEMAPTLPFSP